MVRFNQILKEARRKNQKSLKEVAQDLHIDYSLLSRLENGSRKVSKLQVQQFANYYNIPYKELVIQWLSDKIYFELKDEDYGIDALQIAESRLTYHAKTFNNQSLIQKANTLKAKLDQLRPLEADHLQKLMEYYKVEYTFDSNRIEGNTLSLKETALIIEKGMTIRGKSVREHFETINHAEAVDLLNDFVKNKSAFNERLLLQIHALVLRGVDKSNGGIYRSVNVRISGSRHTPPQPFMLNKLMEDYFIFYQEQKDKLHPVVMAAQMHERLVTIHPFIDGNGRTARLVMNLILMQAGYPITTISSEQENRLKYYDTLEYAQTEADKNPFIEFIFQHTIHALKEFIAFSQ